MTRKLSVCLYVGAATASILGFGYTLWLIFYQTPLSAGPLYFNQKIFYYHVPCATVLFLAVIVCGIASIRYLRGRDEKWDDVAAASGEMAVVFGAIVMVTGVLWAKPAWPTSSCASMAAWELSDCRVALASLP